MYFAFRVFKIFTVISNSSLLSN